MRDVLIGQTDYTVLVKIVGTDGAPESGLTEASIDIAYSRVETDNDVTTTDVTPAALSALTDAHTDWGFEEVSSSDHPGLYRLDIADAVFASGAWEAVVTITDASGTDFYAVDIGFRLVSFNAQDGVRLGLTALPNAAADAAGGLPISDAGGLDLDAQIGTKINDILTDTGTTLQGELDGIQADTEDIQARLPAALTADGNMKADTLRVGGTLQTAGDLAALITTVDNVVDTILVDTNELQTDWVNGGRLDLLLDATLADTNELQTDWANGGRLDLIIDATLADTNELQTDWVNGGRLDLILDATATASALASLVTTVGVAGAGLTALAQASVATEARLAELDAANLPADVDQLKADHPNRPTRGVALADVMFMMVDATDLSTPETGVTVTATISKDGGAFAACANAVSEVSGGWYKIALSSGEMTADSIALKFTGTGCAQRNIAFRTQPT